MAVPVTAFLFCCGVTQRLLIQWVESKWRSKETNLLFVTTARYKGCRDGLTWTLHLSLPLLYLPPQPQPDELDSSPARSGSTEATTASSNTTNSLQVSRLATSFTLDLIIVRWRSLQPPHRVRPHRMGSLRRRFPLITPLSTMGGSIPTRPSRPKRLSSQQMRSRRSTRRLTDSFPLALVLCMHRTTKESLAEMHLDIHSLLLSREQNVFRSIRHTMKGSGCQSKSE